MSYGSNPYRKDNPRRAIGNAAETSPIPEASLDVLLPLSSLWNQPTGRPPGRLARAAARAGNACGNCVAWLAGVPRRAGLRLHALNDAEARWWHWDVAEYRGGLVRQYRDARFAALPDNPGLRRDELSNQESLAP